MQSIRRHIRQVHMMVVTAECERVSIKGHASKKGMKRKIDAVKNYILKGTLWNLRRIRLKRFFRRQLHRPKPPPCLQYLNSVIRRKIDVAFSTTTIMLSLFEHLSAITS